MYRHDAGRGSGGGQSKVDPVAPPSHTDWPKRVRMIDRGPTRASRAKLAASFGARKWHRVDKPKAGDSPSPEELARHTDWPKRTHKDWDMLGGDKPKDDIDVGPEQFPFAPQTQTPKPSQPTPASRRPHARVKKLGIFKRFARRLGGLAARPSAGLMDLKRQYMDAYAKRGGKEGGLLSFSRKNVGEPEDSTFWQGQVDDADQRRRIAKARPDKSNVASLTSNTQPTYNKMAEFLKEVYIYKK